MTTTKESEVLRLSAKELRRARQSLHDTSPDSITWTMFHLGLAGTFMTIAQGMLKDGS